jgi:uncharacterized protein YbjT (DUF2867 family)
MNTAIAGASGFVGRALLARLVTNGHEVVALSRSISSASTSVTTIAVDVGDEDATTDALANVEVAYYLVHSMASGAGFREVDLRVATNFGRASARAGVRRIIYVGALGDAPNSAHLASRHEVGSALGIGGVDVIELRAAVVFGSGSISFEMLRCLTERLPAMVCPRWVRTRIQPIALIDLLDYLEQSLHVAPGIYEIGGAEVTTYRDMIAAYARVRGLHRRRILDIPWLTPHLSSYWVDFVTPVNRSVSHSLIESLTSEVIVTDPEPARRAFSVTPMGIERALAAALNDQDDEVTRSLLTRSSGLVDGVYFVIAEVVISSGAENEIASDLNNIGGRLDWYGAAPWWIARLILGRLAGERLRRRRPAAIVQGALVDWWLVARVRTGELVLRSVGWFSGDAWLGYHVDRSILRQVAAFRPKGVPGFLYWKLLAPVHGFVFDQMARHRAARGLDKI